MTQSERRADVPARIRTVLITGANRGLGLEFARQYRAAGWHVVGTARRPDAAVELHALGVEVLPLDVTDQAQCEALAARFDPAALDLFLCNAGVFLGRSADPAHPDAAEFHAVMAANVLGPMRLAGLLAEAVTEARGTMAFVSSRMGSIASISNAGGLYYRASKAALNAVVKALSCDLGPRGAVALCLHPGWVSTDMGGAGAEIDPVASVTGMRRVIEGAGADANGRFYDYTGAELPW